MSQTRKNTITAPNNISTIPENTLRRNDFKRHSLSSLRKFHPQGGMGARGSIVNGAKETGFNNRNSIARRSAIIPRFNVNRMSAIEEYTRKLKTRIQLKGKGNIFANSKIHICKNIRLLVVK